SESIHHARTELRLPLLLHAQVLVRLSGKGAGGISRRVWHAGRDVRTPDAGANQEAREEDHGGDLWVGVLEAGDQPGPARGQRRDCNGGSGLISVCGYAGRSVCDFETGPDLT